MTIASILLLLLLLFLLFPLSLLLLPASLTTDLREGQLPAHHPDSVTPPPPGGSADTPPPCQGEGALPTKGEEEEEVVVGVGKGEGVGLEWQSSFGRLPEQCGELQ